LPKILYPPINLKVFNKSAGFSQKIEDLLKREVKGNILSSLNRYERKKNIPLALKAFAKYVKKANNKDDILVVAGGWDPRVVENVDHEKCNDYNVSNEEYGHSATIVINGTFVFLCRVNRLIQQTRK